jgi:hypothetical protein
MSDDKTIVNRTGETVTYSQSELETKALNFIKRNKKKACKTMTKGEISEWARLKANAARTEADGLMASGVWDQEAWNRAIRSQILESETD